MTLPDSYLNKYNKQNKDQLNKNITGLERFQPRTGSVYASTGGLVAEGSPINYEYVGDIYGNGKHYYKVNTIRWFVSKTVVSGAYVSLYDDSGGTFDTVWTTAGLTSGRITTSNIHSLMTSGHVFAQINKFGFFGFGNLKFIPFYISDYDTFILK